MPTTVNGVGTHYYGKKNRQVRMGVCQACGSTAALESYDTRLWFVILFIPVIPLGRKRIIDACPRCSRHWAASLAQWEMSKQLSVSGAMEQYRTKPSPEAALELHGNLLGFHMVDEAAQFREQALQEYPENATLSAGLALHLQQMGRFSEAIPLFETALALRPDLPEARIGVARARICDRKLAEARELLSFLEEPGAGQLYSLEPLETLAHAYQDADRHAEALELCERLLAELPSIGQNHNFRRFVALSERALEQYRSILPVRQFSLRGLFSSQSGRYPAWQRWAAVGVIVAVLVLAGLAATNEYRRRHRAVMALNDCGQAAQVVIDDRSPVEVASMTILDVPEGRHHVKVTGPVAEEFDIELGTGYWERWTSSPVWVINVGGGAALLEHTLRYAANPLPSDVRCLIGTSFSYSPHVDYPFTTPPQSLKVSRHDKEVTKVHLERSDEPANLLFQYALTQVDTPVALRFAEARLRRDPEDGKLLEAYVEAAKTKPLTARVEQFLQAGLERRPVSIPWHRAYQDLGSRAAREAAMIPDYDTQLQKEPRSAALLYLRGRLTAERAQADEFFRRASEADPSLPWPWMALAFTAASDADWPKVRSLADKALALKLNDPGLRLLRRMACLAVHDTAALEAEDRQLLATDPFQEGLWAVIELCDLLAVQGRAAEAQEAFTAWGARVSDVTNPAATVQVYREILWYILGDFDTLKQAATQPTSQMTPDLRIHVLCALGREKEAANDPALEKARQELTNAISLSVAFGIDGNASEAAVWRERACVAMEQENADLRRAAVLLRAPHGPSQKEIRAIALYPNAKALILAALAVRFPEQRTELAAMARKLNISRLPPYHLIRQVTDGGR
jgi:tetratricopeptide (TPR) repeat protein